MITLALLAQNIPRTSFLRPVPESIAYIAAVEQADSQQLEFSVKSAFNIFIRRLIQQGSWNAMEASCLLCGARTLAGCLVPLKGPAPTAHNFVNTDYDRKFGLLGNSALNKYLDSNRNNNADPQDNNHNIVAGTNLQAGFLLGAGSTSAGANNISSTQVRNRTSNPVTINPTLNANYCIGVRRVISTNIGLNTNGVLTSAIRSSQTPFSDNILLFSIGSTTNTSTQQIMFYSIGTSTNLGAIRSVFEALRSRIQEWI